MHPSLSLSLKQQTLIKQAYAAYAVAFAASDSRIIQWFPTRGTRIPRATASVAGEYVER